MPIDTHPKRKAPNTEQIAEEQKRQARQLKEQQAAKNIPAAVTAAPPAALGVDNRTPEERYVDEIAPSVIAGQLVKFSKEGKFIVSETEQEISPDDDFVALCDETLIGWIKFSDDDAPPERHQGLLYQGFVMPKRDALGDMDQRKWPEGLSGQPEDPWRHQVCLVLQDPKTSGLFTFVTSSLTGRRACGNLLRHFDRLRRSNPDNYPIVRLKPSGFNHKDERVGWVHTPSFVVVGLTTKNFVMLPDTSPAADLNDQIPY
jgi:hypothetical protein